MKAETVNARVSKALYVQLADFSNATRVPISRLIDDALVVWLMNIAPAKLKALTWMPGQPVP